MAGAAGTETEANLGNTVSPPFGELSRDPDACNKTISKVHESWIGKDLHLNKQATYLLVRALFRNAGPEDKFNRYVKECSHCKTHRFDPEKHKVNLDWKLTPLDFKQLFHKKTILEISTSSNSQSVELSAKNSIRSKKEDMSMFLNPEELPQLKALSEDLKGRVRFCYERLHKVNKRVNIEADVSLTRLTEMMNMLMGEFNEKEDLTILKFRVQMKNLILEEYKKSAREEFRTSDRKGTRSKRRSGKGSAGESTKQSTQSKSSDDLATNVKVGEAKKSAGDELQPPDSGMAQETTKLKDNKEKAKGKTDEAEISSAGDRPPDSSSAQADRVELVTSDRKGARSKKRSGKGSAGESTKQSMQSKSSDDPAAKGKVGEAEACAVEELQPPDRGMPQEANKLEEDKGHPAHSSKPEEITFDPRLDDAGLEKMGPKDLETIPDMEGGGESVTAARRRGESGSRVQYDRGSEAEVKSTPFDNRSTIDTVKHLSHVTLFTLLTITDINPRRHPRLTLRLLPEEEMVTHWDYFVAVFHFPIPDTPYFYHFILVVKKATWKTAVIHSHLSTTQESTADRDKIKESVNTYFSMINEKKLEEEYTHPGIEIRMRIVLPFSNCGLAGIRRDVTADHEIVIVSDGFVDYYLGHVIYIIKHIVETVPLSDYHEDCYKTVLNNCLMAVTLSFNQMRATQT